MLDCFVGPMPVAQFLEDFLSLECSGVKACPVVSENMFKTGHLDGKDPRDSFIEAVTRNNVFPKFQLVNTSKYRDTVEKRNIPDIAAYKAKTKQTGDKILWSKMELYIDFAKSVDTFQTFVGTNSEDESSATSISSSSTPPPTPALPPESTGQPLRRSARVKVQNARVAAQDDVSTSRRPQKPVTENCVVRQISQKVSPTQLMTQTTHLFTKQPRIHLFSILIFGTCARFLRWDRAGVIYTDKFNYHRHPQLLADFLWRFAHLDEERGVDTTVTVRGSSWRHYAKWTRILKAHNAPGFIEGCELREFAIPKDQCGDVIVRYIAANLVSNPRSLTGRAMCGYAAVNMDTEEMFFIKESWRILSLGKEGTRIQKLNEANVPNIPKFVHHADVRMANTITGNYTDFEWNREVRQIRNTHQLYRLVTEDVLSPLSNVKSSRQLLQVVKDAFEAHEGAWRQCSILHRDISTGNIMIRKDGTGILNDWDQAISSTDIKEDGARIGTTEFMSTLLLQQKYGLKAHDIQDDIESFIHVVMCFSLKQLPHNKMAYVIDITGALFTTYIRLFDSHILGGENKYRNFMDKSIVGADFKFDSKPLQAFWIEACDMVRDWLIYKDNQFRTHGWAIGRLTGMESSSMPADATTHALHDHSQMRELLERLVNGNEIEYPIEERTHDRPRKRKRGEIKDDAEAQGVKAERKQDMAMGLRRSKRKRIVVKR